MPARRRERIHGNSAFKDGTTHVVMEAAWKRGQTQQSDSAEEVFFRKSEKNILHTDAI
jgi:hypothetical protein